ncbi:MAG: hypothetical protein GY740_18575, partial [Gammaproteobacteria bacterium]|nr:hypothetical protein [Gammaproteobacteria bacterium]
VAYGALLKASDQWLDTHNLVDFCIDQTPFKAYRNPEIQSLAYGRAVQDQFWMDEFEQQIRNLIADMTNVTGMHPVLQHKEFAQYAKEDPNGLGSQARPSDFTAMIEYYKLEEWTFNFVTLNPQIMRHQVMPAVPVTNDERASTMMDYTRPLFSETEYDLLHRPESNVFDATKLGDSVLWTKEIINEFVSKTLLWPHRDNNQLDLNEQFHTLVQQRDLGHH